jgi:hypothetical protein
LTQENHLSRLALLNPVLPVGIFRETLHCRKVETQGILSLSTVNEQLPEDEIISGLLHPTPKHSAEVYRNGQPPKFQDLRAMSMTKNERIRAAIPHQGERTLNSHARFFLPRGNKMLKLIRRESTGIRRIRHGFARAIEDLRGMRLSLVPRPDSRERVLQGM